MAKLRNPLFGYGAAGTLGRVITIQRHRRAAIARRKPTPTDPQSNAQLSQRSAFTQCNFFWTLLTPAQQHTYRQLRYPPHLTGHQRYVRLCLEGKVPPPPGPFVNLWVPDAPPPSPSDYDDEFNDQTLDLTKWTLWDPGQALLYSEQPWGLDLYRATPPGDAHAGIIQPLPSSSFTIYTKLSLLSLLILSRQAHLLLGQDLLANPATSPLITLGLDTTYDSIRLTFRRWTDYAHWGEDYYFKDISLDYPAIYLYLRCQPPWLTCAFSPDGLAWAELTRAFLPWTPQQMGVAINTVIESGDCRAVFSFFRYIPTADPLTPMSGNRLIVGWPT